MKRLFVFAYYSLVICLVRCAKLPSEVPHCKITDSPCLKTSTQKYVPILSKGIPEFGVPVFDPLLIGNVRNNDGVLNFNFTDVKIVGIASSVINDISFEPKKKRMNLIFTNTGFLDSDYKTNGRLLIFPVVGNGRSFFKTYDIQYVFKIQYDIVKGDDNKDHMKIVKHKVTYTPKSVEFKFTNLFNGNKQLADTIHQFGNENWRDLFPELGKPFMIRITNLMVENMNKIFAHIPMDELFLQ